MDLLTLLGKYKLSAAGLGPGVPPCLPPLSVRYQARGIGCGTARRRERALSPARVRSGTNEWEGSSSWDPARGRAAALGSSQSPGDAVPEPARGQSGDRGELPEHAGLRKPIQPLFQQSV